MKNETTNNKNGEVTKSNDSLNNNRNYVRAKWWSLMVRGIAYDSKWYAIFQPKRNMQRISLWEKSRKRKITLKICSRTQRVLKFQWLVYIAIFIRRCKAFIWLYNVPALTLSGNCRHFSFSLSLSLSFPFYSPFVRSASTHRVIACRVFFSSVFASDLIFFSLSLLLLILLVFSPGSLSTCNSDCSCDYVKYSPICGENGNTYISACHAGCTEQIKNNDTKVNRCLAAEMQFAKASFFSRFTILHSSSLSQNYPIVIFNANICCVTRNGLCVCVYAFFPPCTFAVLYKLFVHRILAITME